MACNLCPRRCGAQREDKNLGFCGQPLTAHVAKIYLHPYEEPVLCGKNGSGAIFFCGCSLRCVFCQNRDISHGGVVGREYSAEELAAEMLELERSGAANINLITAAHFADTVARALKIAKKSLRIPVVYNSSGYESVDTLKMLSGLVDVYMPDFKYASAELAGEYSSAPDYPSVAEEAIMEMYRQVGRYELDREGNLVRGVLVRHLVLPACRADSIAVLRRLAKILPVGDILLSLMRQYTPDFALDCAPENLHRRLTEFEYSSVLEVAVSLGFDGFTQSKESAQKSFTPSFKENKS